MNRIVSVIVFFLCFIPLALKGRYMIDVWSSTPLERWGFGLWLAIPLSALICEFVRTRFKVLPREETKRYIMIPLLLALFAAFIFLELRPNGGIHAISILLAISIIVLAVDVCFGRAIFMSQVPSYIFAYISCPSLLYWIDSYFSIGLNRPIEYMLVKMAVSILFLIVWCVCVMAKKHYPQLLTLCFIGGVIFAIVLSRIKMNDAAPGDSFEINLQRPQAGEWVAQNEELRENDNRFFKNIEKVSRKAYYDNNSRISLLIIGVATSSDVHPIGICLKGGGYDVETSKQETLKINGKDAQVNELVVSFQGKKYLVYSWFSNEKFSTGDFTKFRLSVRKFKNWSHYQLMTPITDKNTAEARTRVENFFTNFAL